MTDNPTPDLAGPVYDARVDGTPVANVMFQVRSDDTTRTWWRQDDDTWTDGTTVRDWTDLAAEGRAFTPIRPFHDPTLLLHTVFVERDSMAKAVLAGELERWYLTLGWPEGRHHAVAELSRVGEEGDLRFDDRLQATLADALRLSVHDVQNAVRRPSRTKPARHLWEVEHPLYGADGTRGDETHFDTFDELRQCLNRHPHDGSTLIYRWDWIKADPDNPDLSDAPEDTFSVYGLLPRNGHLFVLSCPVSEHQEADVFEWLRGPRMLGALQALWAPLLDTTHPSPPQGT